MTTETAASTGAQRDRGVEVGAINDTVRASQRGKPVEAPLPPVAVVDGSRTGTEYPQPPAA